MIIKHRRLFQANNRLNQYFFGLSAYLRKTLPSLLSKLLKVFVLALISGLPALCYSLDISEDIYALIDKTAKEAASIAHPEVPLDDIVVTAMPLHQTISSKQCDDLQFQTQGQRVVGRLSGKLICANPNWSAYLSYQVEVFANVVVTAEPISRGATLQASQVKIQRADLGSLKTGYFHSIAEVLGFTARRTLKPGLVLTSYVAEPPYLVNKGDWVTIVSGSGAIRVTATGEALRSGRYGEQIPVRNLSSKETIKGWINKKGSITTRKSEI